jgi:WD40 repeat protein
LEQKFFSCDREIRIWRLADSALTCLLVGSGHTEALGGLAFSRVETTASSRLVSVSKDTTIKIWTIDYASATMASIRTEIGHDKGKTFWRCRRR